MTPEPLVASIMQYGPWLVFGNVLLQQLGLPVPVWPTLLVVGSLAAGWPQLALALVAAVGAAMVADRFWYWLGRRYGYKVLALLCRLSLNPGSCVTQTEQRFGRWGAPALLVAKFVPGFSAVAAPVAGLSRMPVARFTLAAASGAALWAGAGLLTGWLLRGEVGQALAWMRTHGPLALLGLGAALALWLGAKAWRRHRFRQRAAMPHIDIGDLRAALAGAAPPRLLDFRSPALIAADAVARAGAPRAGLAARCRHRHPVCLPRGRHCHPCRARAAAHGLCPGASAARRLRRLARGRGGVAGARGCVGAASRTGVKRCERGPHPLCGSGLPAIRRWWRRIASSRASPLPQQGLRLLDGEANLIAACAHLSGAAALKGLK